MCPYWTCLLTNRHEEARAAHYAERAGFEFYHPLMWVPRREGLRRQTLFPGYLFVRVTLQNWSPLCSMRGVRRVLLTADNPPQPTRIADREIDLLMSLEDEDGIIIPPPRFSAGDEVEIIGGKRFWVGSHGLVKRIEPNGKALVLLSLLGRRVATRFAVAHLEFAQAPVGMAALAKGMDARARARLLRRVMDA